jgi:hypothetical protein
MAHSKSSRDRRAIRKLADAVEFLFELENRIMAIDARILDALAANDAKIADVSAKVDAFIAAHPAGQSEADVVDLVGKVQAQGAAVDAVAAKLV